MKTPGPGSGTTNPLAWKLVFQKRKTGQSVKSKGCGSTGRSRGCFRRASLCDRMRARQSPAFGGGLCGEENYEHCCLPQRLPCRGRGNFRADSRRLTFQTPRISSGGESHERIPCPHLKTVSLLGFLSYRLIS